MEIRLTVADLDNIQDRVDELLPPPGLWAKQLEAIYAKNERPRLADLMRHLEKGKRMHCSREEIAGFEEMMRKGIMWCRNIRRITHSRSREHPVSLSTVSDLIIESASMNFECKEGADLQSLYLHLSRIDSEAQRVGAHESGDWSERQGRIVADEAAKLCVTSPAIHSLTLRVLKHAWMSQYGNIRIQDRTLDEVEQIISRGHRARISSEKLSAIELAYQKTRGLCVFVRGLINQSINPTMNEVNEWYGLSRTLPKVPEKDELEKRVYAATQIEREAKGYLVIGSGELFEMEAVSKLIDASTQLSIRIPQMARLQTLHNDMITWIDCLRPLFFGRSAVTIPIISLLDHLTEVVSRCILPSPAPMCFCLQPTSEYDPTVSAFLTLGFM